MQNLYILALIQLVCLAAQIIACKVEDRDCRFQWSTFFLGGNIFLGAGYFALKYLA